MSKSDTCPKCNAGPDEVTSLDEPRPFKPKDKPMEYHEDMECDKCRHCWVQIYTFARIQEAIFPHSPQEKVT